MIKEGQIFGCSEGYTYSVRKVGNGRVRVEINGYGVKKYKTWIPLTQMKDLRQLT